MVQSFIIYGVLIIAMAYLGSNNSNFRSIKLPAKFLLNNLDNKSSSILVRKKYFWRYNVVVSLLLFAIISGLRFDVGVDYLTYLDFYQNISKHLSFDYLRGYEIGFTWILLQFSNAGLHFAWVFGFLAFIQIFFIYYSFKKEYFLYSSISFILITSGLFFTMMNEIRQSIVCCILIYAIQFANKKGVIKYSLLMLLGLIFHRSAIILIPIFFILYSEKDFFKSIWIQLVLLITSMLLNEFDIWSVILNQSGRAINILNYSDKYGNILEIIDIWQFKYSKGVRYYANFLIIIIIIINSKKLKSLFTGVNFIKYYNLFFIGALLYFITYNNTLMQRPARYFMFMELVIASFTLFYLWKFKSKKNNFLVLIFILLHLSIFTTYVLSNHHTVYLFFWEA